MLSFSVKSSFTSICSSWRSAASELRLSLPHRSLLYSIALELTQVAEVFWRNPVMCKFLMKAGSLEVAPPPACAQEVPAERPIKTATAAAATADADKASSIRHTFRLRLV